MNMKKLLVLCLLGVMSICATAYTQHDIGEGYRLYKHTYGGWYIDTGSSNIPLKFREIPSQSYGERMIEIICGNYKTSTVVAGGLGEAIGYAIGLGANSIGVPITPKAAGKAGKYLGALSIAYLCD